MQKLIVTAVGFLLLPAAFLLAGDVDGPKPKKVVLAIHGMLLAGEEDTTQLEKHHKLMEQIHRIVLGEKATEEDEVQKHQKLMEQIHRMVLGEKATEEDEVQKHQKLMEQIHRMVLGEEGKAQKPKMNTPFGMINFLSLCDVTINAGTNPVCVAKAGVGVTAGQTKSVDFSLNILVKNSAGKITCNATASTTVAPGNATSLSSSCQIVNIPADTYSNTATLFQGITKIGEKSCTFIAK